MHVGHTGTWFGHINQRFGHTKCLVGHIFCIWSYRFGVLGRKKECSMRFMCSTVPRRFMRFMRSSVPWWNMEHAQKNAAESICSRRHFWSIYTRLVVRPLEASCLDVLEVRRSGREAIDVEKSRIKDPVSVWRTINVVAAFESPVIVGGVEQIDQ